LNIQDEKLAAEIKKIEAETASISKGNSWLKSWTPLLLSGLAIFGGWTQYTKLSIEDREASVEAREYILRSEEKLEEQRVLLAVQQKEYDKAQAALAVSKSELKRNQLELADSEKELEAKEVSVATAAKNLENKTKALHVIVDLTREQEVKLEEVQLQVKKNNEALAEAARKSGVNAREVEVLVNSTNDAIASVFLPKSFLNGEPDMTVERGAQGDKNDWNPQEITPEVAKHVEEIFEEIDEPSFLTSRD